MRKPRHREVQGAKVTQLERGPPEGLGMGHQLYGPSEGMSQVPI